MSAQLLINALTSETRIALIENGLLQEVHIERPAQQIAAGNIYIGRVNRVMPGIQAAFIDIGLEQAAFLHLSDIVTPPVGKQLPKQITRDIRQLVSQGQHLLVQVVKEPLGTKGARLTTEISLPSRYLVFMPGTALVGISQRITDEAERERLKQLVTAHCDDQDGFIVRTVAEGAQERDLIREMALLKKIWRKIQEKNSKRRTRGLLHSEVPLAQRILRDYVGMPLDAICIDSRPLFETLSHFVVEYAPEMISLLQHYQESQPLFDLYRVEKEIGRALQRNIAMRSGGYVIIEQTEALTTVDVNTGAFVGRGDAAKTILQVNVEAAHVIARQLRLRNLGGIIIIDFIDMVSEQHRQQVLRELESALKRDKTRTTVYGFSALGLVELTRKRTRESLEHILCLPCSTCDGSGRSRSLETIYHDIMRAVVCLQRTKRTAQITLYVSPEMGEVINTRKNYAADRANMCEDTPLIIEVQPRLSREQFSLLAD